MESSGENKSKHNNHLLLDESCLHHIVQNATSIILVNNAGAVREVNLAASNLFGYRFEEFTTLTLKQILEIPDESLKNGIQSQGFGFRKNGERFRCAVSVSIVDRSPHSAFTCLTIIDISKSETASESEYTALLKQTERKFQTLIERFSDAFISLDKNLNFTYVNKKAAEMARRDPESLIGKNVWEEFPEAVGTPTYHAYLEALHAQRHLRLEDYFEPLDIWVEYNFYPSPDGLSVFIQDTTEQKRQQKFYQLEREVLEFYTGKGASVKDTIKMLIDGIQQIHPEMLCTVLQNSDGKLYTWASQLPEEFNNVINGIQVGEGSGVCGTAAFRKEKVVVSRIADEAFMIPYRALADRFQIKSCWSHPILDKTHQVLGTFAIYYRTEHTLKQSEELTMERATTILQNIIENKLAHEAIQKSEEIRRLIMNSALDAIICINPEGNVTLWNPLAEKIFGWKEDEMLGKHMADFIIPERYRPRHEEGIRHYLKTGEGPLLNKLMEISAINRQQKEFPIAITILPVKQGGFEFFCAFIEDISERKNAEALLQKMNAQLLSAQHIARLGYWELDLMNNSSYWSDEIFNICGVEKEKGKASIETFAQLIHPDDKKDFLENYQLAVKGIPELRSEYRIILSDGTLRYILIEASRICDEYGVPIRLEGTIQDITKIKENELTLIELNTELEKRAEELIKSNNDLEQFAYVASHDLQEPLRMVTSFLTQIEKKYNDLLDEKGKQYIFFAVDGATRMRRIILDLLEFSRVGQIDLNVETIDMNELVQEVIQLNQTIIEEKNAQVSWSDLPEIRFPRTAIQQVIQNLFNNALKYQPPGQLPKIVIKGTELTNHWQFSVSDNGIGIDSKFFDKIFVLFKRLHGRESYSGTGLGLAICKRIVESHKGKIWVDSIPGKGSTFYFTIPKQF
jgi:PAS domain S-box-containing protein